MESVSLGEYVPNEPSFYLFKHKDLRGLDLPLKGSQRVKYTSFHVSNSYIALGTNAGGIHIFRRSSLRHYRFLNAKVFQQPDSSRIVDVCVSMVRFSNHENFLAAALSSGNVAVWALNFDKRDTSQVVKKSDEHKGSTVTSLCWNSSSTKLFIGDNKGCATGLEVCTGKIRNVHTIVKEGPAIVQMDFAGDKLLLSNTKRCVFYHLSKENLVQVGTKPRDGLYGACFVQRQSNEPVFIYCARPGARLWEADSSGNVISTQQYKKLLACSSTPIMGNLCGNQRVVGDKYPPYNFPKLLVLRDHFLLSWTRESIIIIDPVAGKLILWNNQFDDIEDICCCRQETYIFHTGGHVTRYSLIPPKECAAKLFVMGDWLQCSKVLISCKSQIIASSARDYVPVYVVRRVKDILKDGREHEEIVNQLEELEENLEGVSEEAMTTANDGELSKSLLVDNSETQSVMSDLVSNPDSENTSSVPVDSGLEDIEETSKPDTKEKLSRLKNMFQGQLRDLSLDSVLLAGAHAAGSLNWSAPLAFSPSVSRNSSGSSWPTKSPVYYPSSPIHTYGSGEEKPISPVDSTVSITRSESVGLWIDGDSDSEEKKDEILFKDKKKKKRKVNTVDLISPLQPTDLIKMEKTIGLKSKISENLLQGLGSREDLDRNTDVGKVSDPKAEDFTECDDDGHSGTGDSSSFSNLPQESKEGIRSRSVAAKQEVVQKARNFLKRLTPEEKDAGSDSTKTLGSKRVGSKAGSTCFHAPLEVKSFTIASRETRKKIRDSRILYDPKALRSTLLEWIVYLEKANAAIDRVYPKNKDTREYYVTDVGKVLTPSIRSDLTRFLNADDTQIASSLTTMCFKMNIYSSQELCSSESASDIDDIHEFGGVLNCDTCRGERNHGILGSVLSKAEGDFPSSADIRQDREKSRFLGVNFQHLNYQSLKANIIANCEDRRNLLKILLSCLDDFTERDAVDDAIDVGDTKVALQLMRDKAEHYQKRLLRHVFRLYYLVPRDVSRLCAEIYPYIHPWEVVLVCLSTSSNLFSNCSDFLIYVTHLIQRNTKKRKTSLDIFDEIYHVKDFLILVFHSALILDDLTDSDVRCRCGWPRPNSHQTSFQYEELMIEIANRFRTSRDVKSLEKLLEISWNHGYWQGCMQVLVMLNFRTAALQLVLQLGDISLMSSKQIWGSLPRTPDEWRYALEFVATLNQESLTIESDSAHGACSAKEADRKGIIGNTGSSDVKVFPNIPTELKKETNLKCFSGEEEKDSPVLKSSMYDKTNFNEEGRVGVEANAEHTPPSDSSLNETYQHSCIRNLITGQGSQCINIKSLSLLLLRKCGPKQTLEIISGAQLGNVFFSHEFYYKCILSSLLESHQSALCHRILREVNEHMWSSKCTAMSPQIYQMKELEIHRGSKEDTFKGNEPLRYCRTLEDGACNWGINLPLSKAACGACPLPLCEKLPGHTEGVIIFACGHVFHKECSPDNYCLTCFQSNLEIPSKRFDVASA